jgi:hypothetical protein
VNIVVLGCGPAGLMAAHAACLTAGSGGDVRILSRGAHKSRMNGAQYLHRPIPLASQSLSFKINYSLQGDPDEYRAKIGYNSSTAVSPDSLSGIHEAWDIREAYNWLWSTYGSSVQDVDIRPGVVRNILDSWKPDLVISTIPAQSLCESFSHSFLAVEIWATDTHIAPLAENTVICDGTKDRAWYRMSKIDGFGNTEWPKRRRPPINSEHLWLVKKPTMNTCDCFPEVHRMGRYGRWEKGVLADSAFYETVELLKGMEKTDAIS